MHEISITDCDLWITDPPYADAINYHELGDFFLAWYESNYRRRFPDWIARFTSRACRQRQMGMTSADHG